MFKKEAADLRNIYWTLSMRIKLNLEKGRSEPETEVENRGNRLKRDTGNNKDKRYRSRNTRKGKVFTFEGIESKVQRIPQATRRSRSS